MHASSKVSEYTAKSIQDFSVDFYFSYYIMIFEKKAFNLHLESISTENPKEKRGKFFITDLVTKSNEKKRGIRLINNHNYVFKKGEQLQKLLKFFNQSFFYLRKKNQDDLKNFFSKLSNKTETEEIHEIGSINDLNFSEIKVSKEEEMPKLLDDSYLIKNLVNPSFDVLYENVYYLYSLIEKVKNNE